MILLNMNIRYGVLEGESKRFYRFPMVYHTYQRVKYLLLTMCSLFRSS